MNGLDISPQSMNQPAVLKSEIEETSMGEMPKPVPIIATTPTIEQMNPAPYPYVFFDAENKLYFSSVPIQSQQCLYQIMMEISPNRNISQIARHSLHQFSHLILS